MSTSSLDFAALVGSRICHDLISPIGAINNGMELMSLSGASTSPEMSLISESVDAANARIRFYRVTFGAPNSKQTMGRNEVVSILRDLSRGSRVSMSWEPTTDVRRDEAQVAFLALLCAETALPYGGSIHVNRTGPQWELALTADRFALDPTLWDRLSLSAEQEAMEPRNLRAAHVQFAMLPLALSNLGRKAHYTEAEGQVTLFA